MGMQFDDGLMMGSYNTITNLCFVHTCITVDWPCLPRQGYCV
jgi:hypothetical protein